MKILKKKQNFEKKAKFRKKAEKNQKDKDFDILFCWQRKFNVFSFFCLNFFEIFQYIFRNW